MDINHQDSESLFDTIIRHVENSLKPFRSNTITVTITGESPGVFPVITVESTLYPKNVCVINDYRLWLYPRDTAQRYFEIASRAEKYFRSIPALPVGDNVVLGEN